MAKSDQKPLLEVRNLKTVFYTEDGVVRAVDGVDFDIKRRKTLVIIGESGCCKSVTAFSILQLVDHPGRIVAGQILWHRQAQAAVALAGKGVRAEHPAVLPDAHRADDVG